MGRYLNQGNESFEKSVNSEIYIDKTGVIKYTNRVLNTLQGYVCIRRPDEKIRKKVQENWDSLAKPLDGLGIFEKIFTQIGAVTGDERVPLQKKAVIVMCADNGIVEEGPGRKSHIRLQNPWENEKALSALWLHRRMLKSFQSTSGSQRKKHRKASGIKR